ncbi:MAG: dihydroorotate dehydrogenase-like protein [Gaiellaceae bacterium]
MSPDLRSTYLGLQLKSPLVASASPLTGNVETLKALEEAGAAAVVLPSLFEEQIEHEETTVHDMLEQGVQSFGEALTYFPEMDDYNTGPGAYLEHVAAAKKALSIPVIASINGITPGGWVRYAELLQHAGADAIELNVYAVETDRYTSAASVEDRTLRLVSRMHGALNVPLAVKVGPYYTAFANTAARLAEAGAAGLVLFNRFLQPDIDLEAMTVRPELQLSTNEEMRLPLRWIAILRGRVPVSLAATSGVQTRDDVLKLVLAGADVVMLASALLRDGPGLLRELTQGIAEWLEERDYASVEQLKGSMSQETCGDPRAFERAHYVRALVDYQSQARTRG